MADISSRYQKTEVSGETEEHAQERITPKMLLGHLLSRYGVGQDEVDVAPIVIGSWNAAFIERLAGELHARRVECWPNNVLYTAHAQGIHVSLLVFPVGAPAAVSAMEMLVACGARTVVGVGLTGSLQPSLRIGDVVLPAECLREEGTSYHYLRPGQRVVEAAPALLGQLETVLHAGGVPFRKGRIWTTDAIFRELLGKIERFGRQGVLSVEMETSALYAVGAFRKVAVCNVLVVTDELWDEWNPQLVGSPKVTAALESICASLLASLPLLQGGVR